MLENVEYSILFTFRLYIIVQIVGQFAFVLLGQIKGGAQCYVICYILGFLQYHDKGNSTTCLVIQTCRKWVG